MLRNLGSSGKGIPVNRAIQVTFPTTVLDISIFCPYNIMYGQKDKYKDNRIFNLFILFYHSNLRSQI